MPRRYFSKIPKDELPSTAHLLVILGLMFGMTLLVILLHPNGQ